MSNSKTTIELFADKIPGTENIFIVGEVSYSKGGVNMFSGNQSPRGYRVGVHDETRERDSISFMIDGSPVGRTAMLEEARAFNRKKLELLALHPAVMQRARQFQTDAIVRWQEKEAKRMRDYPNSEPRLTIPAENTVLAS